MPVTAFPIRLFGLGYIAGPIGLRMSLFQKDEIVLSSRESLYKVHIGHTLYLKPDGVTQGLVQCRVAGRGTGRRLNPSLWHIVHQGEDDPGHIHPGAPVLDAGRQTMDQRPQFACF